MIMNVGGNLGLDRGVGQSWCGYTGLGFIKFALGMAEVYILLCCMWSDIFLALMVATL